MEWIDETNGQRYEVQDTRYEVQGTGVNGQPANRVGGRQSTVKSQ